MADSGTTDAGTTDAGGDAGVVDAGATDSGVADGGVADAGVTDSGVADGGADAGNQLTDASVDAGPVDAGPPLSFVAVSAGGYFRSGALTAEGVVYIWGQEQYGSRPIRLIPTALDLGDAGPQFVSLATGGVTSCALTDAGEAWCWGLAVPVNGIVTATDTATAVSGTYSEVSAAQGLSSQMCGVGDGGIYCWGGLQSGGASAVPVLVPGSLGLRKLTCGEGHSCALDDAGAAYCWGDNGHGQLGADSLLFQSLVPLPVAGGHTFASISAGVFHTCAVTPAGEGYCWGELALDGGFGMSTAPTRSPLHISGGFVFADISAGWDWSCGLDLDGGALCWRTSTWTPSRLDAGVQFSTVTTGTAHACGRALDGFVYCWGQGPLGDGVWSTSPVPPVRVAGQ